MSIIRKYHNQTLQINPRHGEEELQNAYSQKTPGRQLKSSNQLALFSPLEGNKALNNKARTKHRTPTNKGSNNKPRINNNRTTAIERTAALATGGAKMHVTGTEPSPYICVDVKAQKCLACMLHEGFLTIAMYHHRETIG